MQLKICPAIAALAVMLAGATRADDDHRRQRGHHADEVIEWNQHMLVAFRTANVSPLVATRSAALVSASVFDAVNGIERRYEPIHVDAIAPRGASKRAAAVHAAYAMLVKLFPTQKPDLDVKLGDSLADIAREEARHDNSSVLRGIDWGQAVADAIWAWRSTDGFTSAPPPFVGGSAVGQWRPTPPANLPGAGPQFANMTPWAIPSPSAYRPSGPPALDSAEYLADYNETKRMGSATSADRTADQTLACNFWAASSATYFWNRVAVSLGGECRTTLSQNARLLATLNLAMADAAIACWEAKYHYVFWRPITAIPLGATDGNPATVEDPLWTTLIVTPNFPEYPSGHSTVSGAAAAVLAAHFGDDTSFTVDSDVMLGVTRSFTSFSEALEEVKDARIFAGIHFRAACDDGQATGIQVADYILENSMQRRHGKGHGHFHH
jgi:hypothetical protein